MGCINLSGHKERNVTNDELCVPLLSTLQQRTDRQVQGRGNRSRRSGGASQPSDPGGDTSESEGSEKVS